MGYKIVQQVHRKTKKAVKPLKISMIILGILFLLFGIFFNRGLLLPCFLMVMLYYYFEANSNIDYEYTYEDRKLTIDVMKGRRTRSTMHILDLEQMVITAPHDHEAVDAYRKGSTEGDLPKFDYTSYDDAIPYYTMIAFENEEKIKLLLDLNKEMLTQMHRDFPQKVIS